MGTRRMSRPAALAATVGIAIVMAAVCTKLPIGDGGGSPARLILGISWLLVLVFCLSGWGSMVLRAAGAVDESGWAVRAAVGLAAVTAVGGTLNLTGLTSDFSISLLLSAGAAAAALRLADHPPAPAAALRRAWQELRARPAVSVGLMIVLLLTAVQVAGSVHGVISDVIRFIPFDIHDDNQAYLPFAKKLLETGSLGFEPFEARRMLSLGGQSFLQTLVLTALPLRCVHLLDAGVAVVIIIGLVWGAANRSQMDRRLALLALLLALTLPHLEARGNTSAVLTGTALLLGWFMIVHRATLENRGWLASGCIGGLMAGALVCIKSTFLPTAGLYYLLTLLIGLLQGHRPSRWYGAEAASTVVTGSVVLAPWMVSLYLSSGTLFYPLLGRGTFGGRYSDGFADIRGAVDPLGMDYVQALVRLVVEFSPLVLLFVVSRTRGNRAAPALAMAVLASLVLLVAATDPELNRSLYRYVFPGYVAGLLALLVTAFEPVDDRSTPGLQLPQAAAIAVATWIVLAGMPQTGKSYVRLAANVVDAVSGPDFVSARDRAVYREMLGQVPHDAPVLSRLRFPFLIEPASARIMVMGFPGMSSPPPGMPLRSGGEALADYLTGHAIRYLAYTYRPETGRVSLLNLTPEHIRSRYPRSRVRWAILRYHELFHGLVRELMSSRKRLYDSGDNVVLDLGAPVVSVRPEDPAAALEGVSANGWTSGALEVPSIRLPRPGGVNFLRVWTNGWHPFRDRPDLIRPSAAIDGVEMKLVDADSRGFLFEFSGHGRPVADISLTTTTFEPSRVGACDDGNLLGLDISSIEIYPPDVQIRPTANTLQEVGPTILPEAVALKSNFYPDNNWTNGDGLLDGISYRVRESDRRLVVTCRKAHPFLGNIRRLALRVWINGIELEFLGGRSPDFSFALYEGLDEVNRIRISSSTFVPSELGSGNDDRTLGVPIRSIAFTGRE